jgi:hypothetical protein
MTDAREGKTTEKYVTRFLTFSWKFSSFFPMFYGQKKSVSSSLSPDGTLKMSIEQTNANRPEVRHL